jgi:hypothetical protein
MAWTCHIVRKPVNNIYQLTRLSKISETFTFRRLFGSERTYMITMSLPNIIIYIYIIWHSSLVTYHTYHGKHDVIVYNQYQLHINVDFNFI